MSTFNSLEKNIARLMAKSPALKKCIKNLYSRLTYLYYKKSYKVNSAYKYHAIGPSDTENFFGYYDKCPIGENEAVLTHVSENETFRKPSAITPVKVQVSYHGKIALSIPTTAYNWQQGSRAHWLNRDLFIMNDFDTASNTYISRVYSINEKREVKTFGMPIQDSFKTDYILSLNYRRLLTLRPDYGYRNLPVLTIKELQNLDGDGIWKIDFKSGKINLLYPLRRICLTNEKAIFMKAYHKINHIMIAPDGEKFIFLHRYFIGQRKYDRLLIGESNGNHLSVISDYEMVSHCFWADNDTILGFMRGPNGKDAYWIINLVSGEFNQLPNNALDGFGDGHPNVYKDWFVTDTYPDKARMQHLLLCNWKTGEVKEIGQFFHSFEYSGESRCDLHPRFSPDGKSIYFDSIFNNRRMLYKIEL